MIGFNLGYLYLKCGKSKVNAFTMSILEIISVIALVISCYIAYKMLSISTFGQEVSFSNPERWWTYALLYVPISCMIIYVFAIEKGVISRWLTNRFSLYLAKISPYGFLIHTVVFSYMNAVIRILLGIDRKTYLFYYRGFINGTIGVIISILITHFWMRWFVKRRC